MFRLVHCVVGLASSPALSVDGMNGVSCGTEIQLRNPTRPAARDTRSRMTAYWR
jgi:hypothetical protein